MKIKLENLYSLDSLCWKVNILLMRIINDFDQHEQLKRFSNQVFFQNMSTQSKHPTCIIMIFLKKNLGLYVLYSLFFPFKMSKHFSLYKSKYIP